MTTQTELGLKSPPKPPKQLKVVSYPLEIADSQTVELPRMASVLSIQEVKGQILLWCLVDPASQTRSRAFEMVVDGQCLDMAVRRYLGTVYTNGGLFAWHVFERLSGL